LVPLLLFCFMPRRPPRPTLFPYTTLFRSVDVGRGDQRLHLVPVGTHEAAQAAVVLVAFGLLRVLDDAGPGVHRVRVVGQGGAPQLDQRLADQRVLEAVGAVDVPAVTGAARTAAGLVVGQVGAGAGVVGLLGFPGDQAVLHVDLPAAGAGAVRPMGGAHDLVVLPALPVAVFPFTRFVTGFAMAVGEGRWAFDEVSQAVNEMTHCYPPGRGTGGRRGMLRLHQGTTAARRV